MLLTKADALCIVLDMESEASVVSVRELPLLETEATRIEGVKLRLLLGEEIGADQYWIAHTEFPPGTLHRLHRHPGRDQAIYVVSGELVQTGRDGPLRTLAAGDVVHVPAGTWHGLENRGAVPAFTLAIYGGTGSAEAAGYELRNE